MSRQRRRQISGDLRRWAKEVGFDLVGIAPATIDLGWDRLRDWLLAGKQGEMAYLAENADVRRDPSRLLAGVQSVVVVGLVYRTSEPTSTQPGEGRLSRYAWGEDYHEVIRGKLRRIGENLRETYPEVNSRRAVDSAPIMERDYAQLAGLGWVGKNTLLLHRRLGSWVFLGVLLVDTPLDYDLHRETDHCGSCTRCLDACPTQAFDAPYSLDARRCISYLTIEHRSFIPEELAPRMGDWVYGCDVCQEVCPWNDTHARRARVAEPLFGPRPENDPVSLRELLLLSAESFSVRFSGSAVVRADRDRLVRNAVIAARNTAAHELRPLVEVLVDDPSPVVAETARWALAGWPVTQPPAGSSGRSDDNS